MFSCDDVQLSRPPAHRRARERVGSGRSLRAPARASVGPAVSVQVREPRGGRLSPREERLGTGGPRDGLGWSLTCSQGRGKGCRPLPRSRNFTRTRFPTGTQNTGRQRACALKRCHLRGEPGSGPVTAEVQGDLCPRCCRHTLRTPVLMPCPLPDVCARLPLRRRGPWGPSQQHRPLMLTWQKRTWRPHFSVVLRAGNFKARSFGGNGRLSPRVIPG